MALRGSMGLGGYQEMQESIVQDVAVQTGDHALGEVVQLYASPYFQVYDRDRAIKPQDY